ncbi:hypothetical protein ACWC4C_30505 [Streptomyces olivaceoviridis]|uniref:hypothetical protein n=1 Tax=Streptomyces olivaceoviridis TaxID=1921 RepID=UPI003684147C
MTTPPPEPPGSTPWSTWRKALAVVASAVLSGVVGAWAQNWFADDPTPHGSAADRTVATAESGDGRPSTGPGTPFTGTDPDTYCARRPRAVGSVEWVPCARVTADAVHFGVLVRNTGGRQELRLRLGYVRAEHPVPCDSPKDEVSVTAEAGTTAWFTLPGCSVARVHGAVQATARLAPKDGDLSATALSPTLQIQPNGSVEPPASY